jgi:hypothetical protein
MQSHEVLAIFKKKKKLAFVSPEFRTVAEIGDHKSVWE